MQLPRLEKNIKYERTRKSIDILVGRHIVLSCLQLALPSPGANGKTLTMSLQGYINKKVLVLTSDSRTLVGILLSCDQMTNLVLSDTVERIIRPPEDPEPSSEVSHGLYLVRGDNVVCVGLVDQELDASICWPEVRGAIIEGVRHS